MMIPKDEAIRFPVRCTAASGSGVTGVLPADISDGTTAGNVTVVKADGTLASIALTNGVNWNQVSALKAPGLYHVTVPASATDVLGPLQLAVFPSGSVFVGTVFTGEVKLLDKAAEETLGRWKVHTSGIYANKLVIYKQDGTTVLKTYDLKDSSGSATTVNPFERA